MGFWYSTRTVLEIFWNASTEEEGSILIKIDGQTIFDIAGPNTPDDVPWRTWNIFKVYTSEESLGIGPASQLIDDLEVWSDIPKD